MCGGEHRGMRQYFNFSPQTLMKKILKTQTDYITSKALSISLLERFFIKYIN